MQASITRLWLRSIWASVPGTYATLALALAAEQTARLDAVSGGTVQMTSANGHVVQFGSAQQSLSAEDWAEGCSFLLDLYDAALAALVSSGIASPTDAQVYVEMMDRILSVTRVGADFSGLRTGGVW